jgi:hypothetical protein
MLTGLGAAVDTTWADGRLIFAVLAALAEFEGEDPPGVRLQAIVDIDDTDEVMDLVMDALDDIQVERGLPVYVVTEQPLERVVERLQGEPDARMPALSQLSRNAAVQAPPHRRSGGC